MKLFARRAKPDPVLPITAFWQWWAQSGEKELAGAIAAGDFGSLPDLIGKKVSAIHPGLAWDTSAGTTSLHTFCVTSTGNAELRPLAERWLRAAPSPTAIWQYAAARPASPSVETTSLRFGDSEIDLGLVRIVANVDDDRQKIDVVVFHPAFEQIGDNHARNVSFLVVDWLLGEDEVERWLGGIEVSVVDAEDSVPIEGFPEIVHALAARSAEEDWVLLSSTLPSGAPVLISTLRQRCWIDHPQFDLHSSIELGYESRADNGFPTEASLEELRDYEEKLSQIVGDRGMFVAHESAEGTRILHFFSDSEDQNVRDAIETFRGDVNAVKVHELDPGWTWMRRFS